MAKANSTTRYGNRKLDPETIAEQAERATRTKGSTMYGSRKAGAARPDARPAQRSEGGLPAPANPEQGEERARGDHPVGRRKGALADVTVLEPSPNPFVGASVAEVTAMLEADPHALDLALEAEMSSTAPRKGAVNVLLAAERAREGGPRDTVVAALRQLAG